MQILVAGLLGPVVGAQSLLVASAQAELPGGAAVGCELIGYEDHRSEALTRQFANRSPVAHREARFYRRRRRGKAASAATSLGPKSRTAQKILT